MDQPMKAVVPADGRGQADQRPRYDDTVLLLGVYRQTVTVVRSLARAGYRVIGGFDPDEYPDRSPPAPLRSRFLAGTWEHPRIDSEGFHEALDEFLRAHPDIRAVFPIGEDELGALAKRERPIPDVALVMPDHRVWRTALSKVRSLRAAAAAGLPHPGYARARTRVELEKAVRRIGLPCVIKPESETGHDGLKAAIVHDPCDLDGVTASLNWAGRWVIEPFAAGSRHNVYFFAERGRLAAHTHVEILRTNRLDGTGLAVDGIVTAASPEVLEACRRLVAHLDYSGAGCIQMMVDENGDSQFLEINARLGANVAVATGSGLDLPRLWVDQALGREIPAGLQGGVRNGLRYCWLTGDIRGLFDSLATGGIGWQEAAAWSARMIRTAVRARAHVLWSVSDPRPACAEMARTVRRLSEHLVRTLVRRLAAR